MVTPNKTQSKPYAQELDGEWSIVNVTRAQAIAYVRAASQQRAPGAPVHCGQEMSMQGGRYVCGVCGASY